LPDATSACSEFCLLFFYVLLALFLPALDYNIEQAGLLEVDKVNIFIIKGSNLW